MTNVCKHIKTPRLLLRAFNNNDANALQQLLASNKAYMLPYIPWAKDEPQTVKEKEAKIEEWNNEFSNNTKYSYGVFDKSNNALIGVFFMFTRQGDNILEIGYIIDQKCSGKGYASECTYALTKLCFEEIKIEKVVIVCNQQNVASAKIPEKIGYTHEYTMRKVEKNSDGSRKKDMIWVMFIEEFKSNAKYEPVDFNY